jgi:proliferating cell nuclear antigen
MQLVLNNASNFKKCIEAISVLIDEAELVIKENGLELKATDPSQISMIDFVMPSSSFEKFESSDLRLGLDLNYLNQILSRAQSSDKLTLSLDEKKSFLIVSFMGRATRSFNVPLIDISSSEIPTPRIDFDAEILINAGFLQNALKDTALISTHISLGCDEEKFYVKANSSKGNLNEELKQDKELLPELRVKNECKSMFPLDYLTDILKTASSSDLVTLFLKSNAPIKVMYEIDKAKIIYFLAPRVEK